jgi:hypothetical protein
MDERRLIRLPRGTILVPLPTNTNTTTTTHYALDTTRRRRAPAAKCNLHSSARATVWWYAKVRAERRRVLTFFLSFSSSVFHKWLQQKSGARSWGVPCRDANRGVVENQPTLAFPGKPTTRQHSSRERCRRRRRHVGAVRTKSHPPQETRKQLLLHRTARVHVWYRHLHHENKHAAAPAARQWLRFFDTQPSWP